VVPAGAWDPDGDPVRVFPLELPPGARFDALRGELVFRPDFTQGGRTYVAAFRATDGVGAVDAEVEVAVEDSVAPPSPVVASRAEVEGCSVFEVVQVTDDWLDSPGFAGRSFEAIVVVPVGAHSPRSLPVRVELHGFGSAPSRGAVEGEIAVRPSDPDATYWWGYAESLPGLPAVAGAVPPYTQRRVVHLLRWVLDTWPEADPDRVAVAGASMGGTGAMALGLLHGRHFAYVEATLGQPIARNHRPRRVAQLAALWGPPGAELSDGANAPVWDTLDLTRALLEVPGGADQFVFTHHGKDDPVIHFGAVVHKSPLTGASWYEALDRARAGHLATWDEGGHGPPDPVLGAGWAEARWDRLRDPTTFLRRDLAFPAFTRSAANDDPGCGSGTGTVSWSPESGYAGAVNVAGDTGWSGDRAGALNRFLRWDAAALIDEVDRFAVPLRVHRGEDDAPLEDGFTGPLPLRVDVTPRRVQRFRCLPGERVAWTFGLVSGVATADSDGAVTVPAVPLSGKWGTLELTRASDRPDGP
jgi:hypothetical protein